MSKGPWSDDEDVKLAKLVQGMLNHQAQIQWVEIGKQMNSRTAKQCRERYKHHLDPTINRTALNDKEKDIVWECQRKGITSYASIAKSIPGRTPLQIKNYIYREKAKEIARIKAKMALPHICNVSATRILKKNLRGGSNDTATRRLKKNLRGGSNDTATRRLKQNLRGTSNI